MLKKLLTLSLVAVMLSTAVYAASPMGLALTAYAETTPVVETKTAIAVFSNDGEMDLVQITTAADGTQTANDGVESFGSDKKATDGEWYLAKVKIGSGYSLPLTSMKLQIRSGWASSSNSISYTLYCVPLKKTEFDMAKSAAGQGSSLTTPLTAPSASGSSTQTFTNTYYATREGSIDPEPFTSDHYDGEYIYIAFQVKTSDNSYYAYNFTSGAKSSWKMTVTGEVTNDDVSVDLADCSAIYVSNNKSAATQSVTVNTEPVGKKVQGNDTSWLMLKFTTGKTYTDIVSAKLAVTSGDGLSYGQLEAYKATKEQWDAASASSATLKSADKQTLLASPRVCGELIGKGGYEATSMELDLTKKCEKQLKNGEVYVYVYADNDSGANYVDAKIGSVSLTITGVVGEYTAPAVTDFDDSVLVWNNGSYGFYTTATSGKAVLIAATYTGTTLTDAEVITIDASTTKTNGGYTGTTSLTPGDSLKVFLWSEGTLVPIKSEVIEF